MYQTIRQRQFKRQGSGTGGIGSLVGRSLRVGRGKGLEDLQCG
jgi:hypothetical protein